MTLITFGPRKVCQLFDRIKETEYSWVFMCEIVDMDCELWMCMWIQYFLKVCHIFQSYRLGVAMVDVGGTFCYQTGMWLNVIRCLRLAIPSSDGVVQVFNIVHVKNVWTMKKVQEFYNNIFWFGGVVFRLGVNLSTCHFIKHISSLAAVWSALMISSAINTMMILVESGPSLSLMFILAASNCLGPTSSS